MYLKLHVSQLLQISEDIKIAIFNDLGKNPTAVVYRLYDPRHDPRHDWSATARVNILNCKNLLKANYEGLVSVKYSDLSFYFENLI